MTNEPPHDEPRPAAEQAAPDPYRFGPPDVPPHPDYAPPGYQPPQPSPFGPPAQGAPGTGVFGGPSAAGPSAYGPPASPYGPPGGQSPYGPPAGQSPYAPPGSGQSPYGQPQSPYGQPAPQGYPPPGYGEYPPPPVGSSYPQPGVSNHKATAGMVLGIISIPLAIASFFDIPVFVLGIIFSALGLASARRGAPGHHKALAGLICSIVGTVIAVVFMVVVVSNLHCETTYDSAGNSSRNCSTNID
ncbi:MAG: hypothetical protein JO147_05155 [Actinobacteria bacterium]|nr:hypothetical protein [Actinomycetota bacterium]